MKKVLFVLGVVGFLFPIQMFGWGQIGHRVVGAVAEHHLNKKAKKAVKEILGDESLAMCSTWMDEIKSDHKYDHTHSWHYLTIAYGSTYGESDQGKDGDAIEAIDRFIKTLKSETSTLEEKREALSFLVHVVGDIHQPLHVGNGTDRGGNDLKIKWFYDGSNLHRIWDSEIIDSKQLSYTELACSIDHASRDQISNWQTGTPLDWAIDSQSHHTEVYDYDKDKDNLSYEYMYKNWDLVQEQLLKGGIRLAGLLNDIFG